ncbi:MAG: UvrD-helicase domain-containing protein [Holosporales bacterium]|jgi:ATP-dependent helicase/nuclease subunit A|nr:UvrD-helicase domain-containing protein [Holosporales bacterium]
MREYLDALDTSASCFVFASAGSGKTKTLVDRYVKLLFSGIKPSEILCLTFTNTAVFEMQSRISIILEKLLINENNYIQKYAIDTLNLNIDKENIIKISERLFFDFEDELANLKILTIHSFCKNILNKFPMEADISPNFEIIDDKDSKILITEAKTNVFKHLFDTKSDLLKKITDMLSFQVFEELVESIYHDFEKFGEFFSINKDLDLYKKQLQSKFNLSQIIEFSKEQNEFINIHFNNQNLEEVFLTKTGTIRKNYPHKENKIAREISEIIFKNFTNSKKELTIEKTYTFLKIAQMIFEEYNKLKTRENVIDFADVLIKTKELLLSNYAREFVLSKICSTLKCIMIDEAQDLSYIQWRLITLFCEEIYSVESNKKTMFVVGDIKQSIYRFQNANPQLFVDFYNNSQKLMKSVGKNFKTIYFNRCFRSLPKILEFVDSIFINNSYFAFGQSSIEYKKHIPDRISNGEKIQIIETADADEIVNFIKKLIESQIILPSTGSKIQPQDILILARSRNELYEDLILKLDNNGIKVAPPDRIKLSENILIMDILAIADICVAPFDAEYSLACILKSHYIFKNPLSNSDLYNICHNRTGAIFKNLKYLDYEKTTIINNCLGQYKGNNLVDFFYYIISKIIIKLNKNDEYILSSFINIVIDYANKVSNNIEEFIEYFRKNAIEVSNPNIDNSAIRISTIHSAKGSEAPVVILLDFDLKANKSKLISIWKYTEKIFDNNANNSLMFFIKPNTISSFPEADYYIENEYKEEERELLRLLYVALTRARDHLYLIGVNNGKNVIRSC